MIDVYDALKAIPHFDTFCSVAKLNSLVEELRRDSGFAVSTIGTSVSGRPIHHVCFGTGRLKALFVAGPHCMEPIGSLTVFSLMTMLRQRHAALVDSDIEWHIVPCIDPDGAVLNERWTQKRFSLESYMRNFYVQPPHDQVDMSFPIKYKNLVFDQPSKEAAILKDLIDQVEPDFYYSLHNSRPGTGWFYLLSREISEQSYSQLLQLLDEFAIPRRTKAIHIPEKLQLADGVFKTASIRLYYDQLERSGANPENALQAAGATAQDYLASLKPDALCLTVELDYVVHPWQGSNQDTGRNLRQLKLRIDAENKYVIATILDEWAKAKEDLHSASPFFRKIQNELVMHKDKLHEGLPLAWAFEQTRDLMFNPTYDRVMTEHDLLFAWLWGRFYPLCNAYSMIRLLNESKRTRIVRAATERLERLFNDAFAGLAKEIDVEAFQVIDCDTLARVHLGSGLIVLNSLLDGAGEQAGWPKSDLHDRNINAIRRESYPRSTYQA